MSKDAKSNFYLTIIGVLVAALVGCAGFYLQQLGQKVDSQSNYLNQIINTQTKQILKLEKDFAIIVSVLNMKMPNINLPMLLTLSNQKNVSPEKVATVIPMLEKDPITAKAYLKNQLNFDSKEVSAVIKSESIPLQMTPMKTIKPTNK